MKVTHTFIHIYIHSCWTFLLIVPVSWIVPVSTRKKVAPLPFLKCRSLRSAEVVMQKEQKDLGRCDGVNLVKHVAFVQLFALCDQ